MKRRDSLKLFNLSILGSVLGVNLFASCKSENYIPEFFTNKELTSLSSIAETIIPETDNAPGAGQLKVENFIDKYCKHCIDVTSQDKLKSGIKAFKSSVENKFGQIFEKLDVASREQYLEEQLESGDVFISEFKTLVLFTYFTSKEGITSMLDYEQNPGRYEGDILYETNLRDGE